MTTDFTELPPDLPVPEDDGAADHLVGLAMPALALPSTAGSLVPLDALGSGRTVLYLYPRTGVPGVASPAGWDTIPGARGCTPQACAFRDHHDELRALGATVYGVSTQTTVEQREAATRLHLPFELLSDAALAFARALRLPTFEVEGSRLLARLTMIVGAGVIEHVHYPVFPPDRDAARVVAWLRARA